MYPLLLEVSVVDVYFKLIQAAILFFGQRDVRI